MPKPLVVSEVPALKFKGKTCLLAGKFSYKGDEELKAVILSEGGTVVSDVSDSLDYVFVGEYSRGTPAGVKEAEKRVKKGAQIQFINEQDVFAFLVPNKEEYIRLLKCGDAERFTLLMELASVPWGRKKDVSGTDLSNCVFDNFPLSSVLLNNCNLQKSKFKEGSLDEVRNANFNNSTFEQFNLTAMQDCTFVRSQFSNLYFITKLTSCDISESKLTAVAYNTVKVRDCSYKKCALTGTMMDSTSFTDCDFSETTWERAGVNDVIFTNCKFSKSTLLDCWFVNCKFIDCDLTDCDLQNTNFALSKFNNTKVNGSNFTGSIFAGAETSELEKAIGKTTGLKDALKDAEAHSDVSALADVKEVAKAAKSADSFEISAVLEIPEARIMSIISTGYRKGDVMITFKDVDPHGDTTELISGEYFESCEAWVTHVIVPSVGAALNHVSCVFFGYSLPVDTINAKISKGSVGTKDFKNLAVRAFCAAFGMETLSDKEIQKLNSEKKASAGKERDEYIALLRGGADGIKKFNEMMEGRKSKLPLKKVDLSGCDLTSVNLAGADLQGSNFSNCVMKDCSLQLATITGSNFKGANLDGANCHLLLADKVDFSDASMRGVNFSRANLLKAVVSNANCTGADFTDTAIHETNFTNANMKDVKFERTQYNDKTLLPKEHFGAEGLKWEGYGTDPSKVREIMDAAPNEPLDFGKFLSRLEVSIDKERLKKAIKMLQAESFKLFAEVKPDSMIGVVKSQTDPDLVYSCRLTAEGTFCCGTQNLNACGGLRGALCKHLLVLLLGLTKAGELDATTADAWARASKLQNPKMEKDAMSETFLRYKGAEAGEIDWRPTETIPEDYYAF